jgi:pyruvate dehydrogenase E1 component
LDTDRARLRGEERVPFVTAALADAPGPVLAVSDWMRQVPDQISQWVGHDYSSLGTDGFGLSDTRDAVRRYFHVDAESIVVAALDGLARAGAIGPETVVRARDRYGWRG